MKTISLPVPVLLALSLFVAVSAAQQTTTTQIAAPPANTTASAEPAEATPEPSSSSEARIVRLSQVKGTAQLNRNTGKGFEVAFPNLPIAQDQALQTADGVAEVEFEDNSSLRITPDTLIEFPALQRTPTGATITSVKLVKGTLYVSLEKTKGNQFTITLGNRTITLPPSSHIRLDAGQSPSPSRLAVLSGTVQVSEPSGTSDAITTVDKKKALLFDASAQTPSTLGKVEVGQFDEWDKTSADYHTLRSVSSAYGNTSYLYGINDLNYYGSFVNSAGCGSMWRPYFASAAWDPFANGIWAFYPGAGYSWVSPYPWGWTPFHTGSWQYCSTGGWGWRPGGPWYGLRNHPASLNPNGGAARPRPPHRPVSGQPTSLIAYNIHPLTFSHLTSESTFVFRKDSAGLGVPRESLGNLNKLSVGVMQHDSVSAPIYYHQSGRGPDAFNPGRSNSSPSNMARSYSPSNSGQASRSSSSGSGASHGSSSPSFSSGSSSGFSASSSSPSSASSSGSSSSGSSSGGSHK